MQGRKLQTADQVIDALGGTAATARFIGRKDQHVSNWRAAGRLPAKTFLIISEELGKQELEASPEIWGIVSPEKVT